LNKRWKIEKEKIENKQAWSHGDLLLLATGEQWVDYDYVGSRNGSRVQRLLLYLHNLHSTSQSLHAGCRKKTDGPPLEPAYDFAADADTSRTAATRPAFILTSFKRIKNLESQT